MKQTILLILSIGSMLCSIYVVTTIDRRQTPRPQPAPREEQPAAIPTTKTRAVPSQPASSHRPPDKKVAVSRLSLKRFAGLARRPQAKRKPVYYNAGRQGRKIPVLCYHRIDKNKKDHFYLTRERFLWQVRYLAKHCRVISTEKLVHWIRFQQGLDNTPVRLPDNAVVIQFDDNYRSVYRQAWPILRQYKLPWSFFVYKHHHKPNTRAQLEEMARSGVDIQAHSMTHCRFDKPARGQSMASYLREMHWQIGGCKKYLETISGRPVRYMAYPFGTYSDLAVRLCRSYGYRAMFAADGGYATARSPLIAIERILVSNTWSKAFFRQVVHGRARFRKYYWPTRLLRKRTLLALVNSPWKKYL